MPTVSLPKRSFLALAAIGWADGSLQRKEAAGLVRAAAQAGIQGGDLEEIERATKDRTPIESLDVGGLSQWEQVLTYALAAWLAALDGVTSTDEHHALSTLGDALGLDKALRTRASVVAFDIACLPEGGRPERYDFVKLVDRLQERLPQVAGPGRVRV